MGVRIGRNVNENRYPKPLEFKQASKDDSKAVTDGKYTMSTTKPGRPLPGDEYRLSRKRSHGSPREISIYDRGEEIVSELQVRYHMKHTLNSLGIDVTE